MGPLDGKNEKKGQKKTNMKVVEIFKNAKGLQEP
jgi:hypothetical protein